MVWLAKVWSSVFCSVILGWRPAILINPGNPLSFYLQWAVTSPSHPIMGRKKKYTSQSTVFHAMYLEWWGSFSLVKPHMYTKNKYIARECTEVAKLLYISVIFYLLQQILLFAFIFYSLYFVFVIFLCILTFLNTHWNNVARADVSVWKHSIMVFQWNVNSLRLQLCGSICVYGQHSEVFAHLVELC